MKKVLAIFAIVSMTLFGCRKERTNIDIHPEVKEKRYRLSSSVYKNYSMMYETSYRYDSEGYLKGITSYYGDTQAYKRDDRPLNNVEYIRDSKHHVIREIFRGRDQGQPTSDTNDYIYSKNGFPVRGDYYSYNGYHSYDSLTWYKNRLVRRERYNDSEIIYFEKMQYDVKGNVQEISIYKRFVKRGFMVWKQYYNFRYDDMPNVKSVVKGHPVSVYSVEWLNREKISVNNIISVDVEQYEIPSKGTLVYHHTYNEEGYLVNSTSHNGLVSIEYFYEEY